MIYLIEYDRQTGGLIRIDEFNEANRPVAEERRLSIEIELLRSDVEHEVVLLEASSEAELRKTHRRYFERIDQLLKTA